MKKRIVLHNSEDFYQKFGVGDIAMLQDEFFDELVYKVRIEIPIQEDDGSWSYEVKILDLPEEEYKEVPQNRLKAI